MESSQLGIIMSLKPEFAAPRDGRVKRKSPGPALTVFVADDDEAMREAVATSLRAGGHFVVEARDGAELLDLLLGTLGAPPIRPESSCPMCECRTYPDSGCWPLCSGPRATSPSF